MFQYYNIYLTFRRFIYLYVALFNCLLKTAKNHSNRSEELKGLFCFTQVWDTAGQERFRSMAPMYYRNANAAMLVFDLTQYNSFTAIKNWVKELQQNVEETMVLAVIGNKSDLMHQRQIDGEEGQKYATSIGATYHEISVLHNEGVQTVFLAIAKDLLRMASDNTDTTTLKISESNSFFNSDGMPLSPSVEESPQNTSIAHGILEKPFTCC